MRRRTRRRHAAGVLGPVLDAPPGPADACRDPVDLAPGRGGKDDVTAVLGRFEIAEEVDAGQAGTDA